MRNTLIVARRELGGYFATPVAVVFIVIFLALQGVLTFNLGNFFDRDQADLGPSSTSSPGSSCCWSPRSPCGCGPRNAGSAPSSCC